MGASDCRCRTADGSGLFEQTKPLGFGKLGPYSLAMKLLGFSIQTTLMLSMGLIERITQSSG
ncbi:MAG: hypothetical protein EBU31_13190 [Proteobacteria bacterium]|nr:hypothetical protein [Pseudomonadota bacterium]